MIDFFLEHFNYAVVVVLMMTGLYVIFASRNKIKKLVGLSVFQTSVFLFYITLGKVRGGQPPILAPQDQVDDTYGADSYADPVASGTANTAGGYAVEPGYTDAAEVVAATTGEVLYSNPLPHVLILTAIVVGVATLAVGLALIVRIREVYGTVEDGEIDRLDYLYNLEGTDAPKPPEAVSA